MYKLFKQLDLADYGEPVMVWQEIGTGYSKYELENLKKKLPTGNYMLAKCKEFSVPYVTLREVLQEK